MVDDPTVKWRLDRLEQQQHEQAARSISPELYARDRAELERDIADLRRHLDKVEKECQDRVEKAEKRVSDRLDKSGTNWRQSLFQGVLPTLFLALTLLVTVLLALRGAGK
ncbi:hypothetical protein [Actinomadura opuntiae]|uniref:hypothetical protein n=1 Tax=Actinomadura sp. OS1-43 TaxID=604315 RepID=UPI00255A71ED|nr:hypothetical protein [Actinomadura sp. OS1-43]MDL4812827.1 hypothetical protein [Actinomadura sp. OS1-43]